jgi:hypothetical protein
MAVTPVFSWPIFGGDFEGARLVHMRQPPEQINGRLESPPTHRIQNTAWLQPGK